MGAHSLAPLLWFAAIIVAIPVVLWLLKRTPIGAAASSQGGLRSIAVLALTPNQRIVTVEVGHGDARRWLVLGVTPQAITALHEMAPQDAPPSAGEVPATAFAQTLARLRPGGRSDAR
ncbi:MAG: flagellar biosynthetic protein FliO [Pelomonas sp.]|nr:flagellar biosynthetic protein FliO [Roseateles sp.]